MHDILTESPSTRKAVELDPVAPLPSIGDDSAVSTVKARPSHDAVGQAWAKHAPALAAWTLARFVNRRDAFGHYLPIEKRTEKTPTAYTDKSRLALGTLQAHFEGKSTGDLIGLHSTALDEPESSDDSPTCRSRWLAIDIDRHDDSVDANKTFEVARRLYETAANLGLRAMLFDSNGNGGFHLVILFNAPVPTETVFAFAKWLRRDWKEWGLTQDPETFPKQPSIDPGKFGNWIRLPGRHHTRNHFSRFWNGKEWLEGSAAIKAMLAENGNDPGLIPAEVFELPKPRKARTFDSSSLEHDAQEASRALEYLDPDMAYPEWLEIGMALEKLGRDGLNLWDRWSSNGSKYQEGICDQKWKTFGGSSRGVSLGTLFAKAKANGFEFSKTKPVQSASVKVRTTPSPTVSDSDISVDPEGSGEEFDGQELSASQPPNEPRQATASPERPEFHLTDTGNALRFARDHKGRARYCGQYGAWLIWDGKRWKLDSTGVVYQLARQTLRGMMEEAARIEDKGKRDKAFEWAFKSESRKTTEAMIHLAKFVEGIAIASSELDRNPWLLNVENGTLDLQTGRLRAHDPLDLITKIAPVDYDPTAECPRWNQFELEIMDGDAEMVDYLHRIAGYGMTGDVREHLLFFFFGGGRNGKSLWLEMMRIILGDYAISVNANLITVKHQEDHPTGLADLEGRRFVSTIEVEDGKKLAEALVKSLTGGDSIRARRMRQDFYEFPPTHKIILAANHEPEIRGTDDAIWDRVRKICFPIRFVDTPDQVDHSAKRFLKDKGLKQKLEAEASGILASMVRGCLDWQKTGMNDPESVIAATKKYRADMDTIGRFIEERCIVNEGVRDLAAKVFEAYVSWAKAGAIPEILNVKKFAEQMEKRGFKGKKTNSKAWRFGIAIRSESDEESPY